MAVQYIHVAFEEYKAIEAQMKSFVETTHRTTEGFYHKSIRLKVGPDLIMEFHGPLVRGESSSDGLTPQEIDNLRLERENLVSENAALKEALGEERKRKSCTNG